MATKKEDVELGVAVNVTNAERIDALTKDIKQLGDQGVLTAEDFERLNNEVKQIGTQAGAVDGLAKIESELKQTTDALAQATVRADALGTTLAEQTVKTKGFLEAQQKAAQELRDTKQQLIDQNLALDKLNNEYDKAGKRTDEYKVAARKLKDAIAELEATHDRQKLALQDANKALQSSTKELNAAETAAKNAGKALNDLSEQSQEQSQALNLAAAAAKELGLDSTNAATAQNSLARAINGVTKEAVDAYRAMSQDVVAKEKAATVTRALAELEGMLATEREIATAAAAYEAKVLADEAAAAERAAKAIRDQTLALEQQAQALRESVNAALGTVGVRSAQALRAEINQVKDAMGTLRQSGELTGRALEEAARKAATRVRELEFELRQVTNQTTFGDKLKIGFNSLADGANNLIGRFGALGAAIGTLVFAFKPFFDTIIQFEQMRRALTAVTGSTAEALKMIGFLRETANKAGIAFGEISEAFVRFVASARGAGISTQVVQDVFTATAQAAGTLGLSSDKVTHILDALAQMASKGVVSMEELRQQLGDSLPGALSQLAKGLGVTEAQLVKLVENGRLLSADALPALADALLKLAANDRNVDGLTQSFNRFKNALTEISQTLGEKDGLSGLSATLNLVGVSIATVYTGLLQLVELVSGTFKSTFFLLTGQFSKFNEQVKTSAETIDNLGARYGKYVKSVTEAGDKTKDAGDKAATAGEQTKVSGEKAAVAADGHNANAQAQSAAAAAAIGNAQAQSAAGTAAENAGQQASGAIGQWYQLQIAFDELNKRQEQSILNAEVYAKAAKIEGDTRKALAQIAGDEALAVKVAADASELEAQKLRIVSDLRRQEVETLTSQRDQLVQLAQQLGDPGGTRAKEIEKLNATIAARTAEAEKAKQSADAIRLDALARETAAKTYADNSAKLDTLRIAYENTAKAVQAAEQAERNGLATAAQVQSVREKSAAAEALYRDAVKDSAAAVERKTKALESSYAVDKASIEVAKAKLDTDILIRKSLNDTSAVYLLEIEKKKLDLKASQDKIQVMKEELALAKQQIEIDAAAIKQNDPLREQKLQDIELRRQGIQARELEIQRQQEIARQTERQIQLDQQRGVTSLNASGNSVAGLEQEISAQERLNALKEREKALNDKKRGVDAKGFSTDTTGQTVNGLGDTYLSILNQLKGYGLSESEAAQVAREFTDSNGNVPYFNNPGQLKYGGPGGGTLSYAIQQAAAQLLFNKGTSLNPGNAPAPSPSPSPSPAPTPNTTALSTYKVEIKLGSSTTTINTASDADARNLVNTLQTIASRTAA
jgi:tape measure domain-containing protein